MNRDAVVFSNRPLVYVYTYTVCGVRLRGWEADSHPRSLARSILRRVRPPVYICLHCEDTLASPYRLCLAASQPGELNFCGKDFLRNFPNFLLTSRLETAHSLVLSLCRPALCNQYDCSLIRSLAGQTMNRLEITFSAHRHWAGANCGLNRAA